MSDKLFGSQDWSFLNFIMVVVAIISSLPAIGLLFDMITGRPLVFDTIAVVEPPPVDDPTLGAGVSGVYTGDATFTVLDPSVMQWVSALLIPVVTLVVAVVSLLMVRRLVRNARSGDAFNDSSLVSVRVLGLVLFVYGLFRPLIQVLMLAMITTEMRGGELNLAFRFDAGSWWPMVVGVIVAVVGEAVFGRGRELADENEGLV